MTNTSKAAQDAIETPITTTAAVPASLSSSCTPGAVAESITHTIPTILSSSSLDEVETARNNNNNNNNIGQQPCSLWRRRGRRPKQSPYPDSSSTRILHPRTTTTTTMSITIVLFQEFLPKFILEVMGGGGAIWGFSEACGLRTTSTVWFWRPSALVGAALFGLRFLHQVKVAWKTRSGGATLSQPPQDEQYLHTMMIRATSSQDLELGLTVSSSTGGSPTTTTTMTNPTATYSNNNSKNSRMGLSLVGSPPGIELGMTTTSSIQQDPDDDQSSLSMRRFLSLSGQPMMPMSMMTTTTTTTSPQDGTLTPPWHCRNSIMEHGGSGGIEPPHSPNELTALTTGTTPTSSSTSNTTIMNHVTSTTALSSPSSSLPHHRSTLTR